MSPIRPASHPSRPVPEPRPEPRAERRPPLRRSEPALADKPRPALTPFRALLAERPEPRTLGPVTRGAVIREAPREPERAPARPLDERLPDAPLEPFRVMPALLGGPERPVAAPPRPIDEAALALAGDLVEALRVGRLGATGHAVSFRLRRAEGATSVQLLDEGGALRLRLEASDGAGLEQLGARVREELLARGIELEVEVI